MYSQQYNYDATISPYWHQRELYWEALATIISAIEAPCQYRHLQ